MGTHVEEFTIVYNSIPRDLPHHLLNSVGTVHRERRREGGKERARHRERQREKGREDERREEVVLALKDYCLV